MNPMTAPLADALTALDAVCGSASTAGGLSRGDVIAVNDALAVLRRRVEGLQAQVASVIARESRPELGADSLAKIHGFRSTAHLIAATTGSSTGDAARLVRVGDAVAPRVSLLGEERPAKYALLHDAVITGKVSAAQSAAIVSALDKLVLRADAAQLLDAERMLVERAPGLAGDHLAKVIARLEAWVDPDGIAPREEALRSQRTLTMTERDGLLHLHAKLDPESAAPVRAALQGYVTAQFQARQDAVAPSAPDADHRSIPTMQADALVLFAEHVLGCRNAGLTPDARSTGVPLAGAQVVLRVRYEDLETGTGSATLDGVDQPISITTARRIAADGNILPWVCGADGEILDAGRTRRLFTPTQRQLLAERDGGCAMCGLPPGMTKAHHIRWWHRDTGPTNLNNGVLLCTSCHHRIHDNGWNIHIDGDGVNAKVWFIPPPHVDPQQTPRLGGRARYDIIAA